MMQKMLVSIKTMLKIALDIDKKSIMICVAYNLIKHLMNVFYGVYFIRMILAGLEMKQSFGHILAVLMLMFVINILFVRFDQYYKNIYLPIFKLKVDSYMNEKIMRKANSIPYTKAVFSNELDKYNRVIENSSKMLMRAYQAFGLVCGLFEAFVMVLYYIVNLMRTESFFREVCYSVWHWQGFFIRTAILLSWMNQLPRWMCSLKGSFMIPYLKT